MSKIMWVALGAIIIGIWMLVDGIRLRRGTHRSWFYVHRTPTIVMPNIVFGFIPGGLGALVFGFLGLSSHYGWFSEGVSATVFGCIITPLFVLGFVFWLWKPRWLQPDWYRWLNDHYGSIMPVLKKDARRLGKAWLDRVRTQEGLERWAEEVRQRHRVGTLPK